MAEKNLQDKQTLIVDVRQLVSLDTAESYLLCLNQNTWLVVQMLHSFYASWRNRYTQNSEVKPYLQPDDTQYRLVLDSFDLGEMELSQVTCLQDLIEALNGIKAGIETVNTNIINLANTSACCGSGSGGAGTSQETSNPYDETTEPETPPDGFDDMAAYRSHKCDAADMILDNLVHDLQKWSIISITGLLLTGLAGAWLAVTLSPIPFDDLLFIAGVIIAGGLLLSYLAELSTIINDEISNLICEIYNAPNADQARTDLIAAIEVLIDDAAWDTFASNQVKSILPRMITTNALNRVFEPGEQFEGDGDCSECGVADWHFVADFYGSGSLTDNPMELASIFDAGRWRLYICRPEGMQNVTLTSITGYTPSPSTGGADDASYVDSRNCEDSVDGDLYLDDDPPTGLTYNSAFWGFNSTTEFSVVLTKS